MKLKKFTITLILVLCNSFSAGAQSNGLAEITQPRSQEPISGTVEILGTASFPNLRAFEVAFAYDPNPDEIWYTITVVEDRVIEEGLLAKWDTSGISDGTYLLRLRVWIEDGSEVSDIVEGLELLNAPPSEVPSPTQTLVPTPAPSTDAEADEPGPSHKVVQAFMIGSLAAAGILAILGGYSFVQTNLRHRWISQRSRFVRRRRRKMPKNGGPR